MLWRRSGWKDLNLGLFWCHTHRSPQSIASDPLFFQRRQLKLKWKNWWVKELWWGPWSWSSVLFTPVCLTLNHHKHYVTREAALHSLLCPLDGPGLCKWWWVRRSQDATGVSLVKDFKIPYAFFQPTTFALASLPAHPIIILFPIRQHTQMPAATASTSSCKAKGKQRGGLSTLSSVPFWNFSHFFFPSFFQIACSLSSHLSLFSRLVRMVEHWTMCSHVPAGPRWWRKIAGCSQNQTDGCKQGAKWGWEWLPEKKKGTGKAQDQMKSPTSSQTPLL